MLLFSGLTNLGSNHKTALPLSGKALQHALNFKACELLSSNGAIPVLKVEHVLACFAEVGL